jgi:uncharacterized protein YabE (DUF348 family)
MNNLIRKSTTPFGAVIIAVFFLMTLAIISISNVTHATDAPESQSGRLITIYDRGVEKVILSQAATIGDVLREANIAIDDKDVVEPATTEKLVASSYQVNIYRARPVVIVDGSIRQRIMTPYQTTEQIVASAGITLYPEDETAVSRIDNLAEGAGLQLVITRAIPFSFTLYGKTAITRSQGKTVGEMLTEKGIKLNQDDRVLPSQDTPLTAGMPVRVWREGKQTITIDEPVDFETEQIENADQSVGYKEIKIAGIAGERSVTYEVIIQDGVEVGRTEIAGIITKQPVKQVETIGIKGKYNTPSENETVVWDFLISQGFGRIQVAGIMGNLAQEHHFNTTDTSGGLGIVQWTGARRTRLISKYPDSYTNIYSQLDFLMEELNGSYSSVRDTIRGSGSISEVVKEFEKRFEACNPNYCLEDLRVVYAQNILGSH